MKFLLIGFAAAAISGDTKWLRERIELRFASCDVNTDGKLSAAEIVGC